MRDIRSSISVEAHAALLAEERATGQTLSDQVRVLVESWASKRIHAARVLSSLLRDEERMSELSGDDRK